MSTTHEIPATVNTATFYCEQHSRFDAQAEALRQQILALPDTVKAAHGAKTIYISYRGDDAADGRTPETAWRTTANLQDKELLAEGDAVLFERGGVYRSVCVILCDGVGYGAYGEGPKPQLFAGDKNYADPELWERIDQWGVWRTRVPADPKNRDNAFRNDIGNILFDHGRGCASEYKRLALSELRTDFEFYHDVQENWLYLCHTMGNPGARFESIEIAPKVNILTAPYQNHGIVIENLCLKYTGAHAIGMSRPDGCTIRGCEIGYIGGSMLKDNARYGNGIEFYSWSRNMLVENNWIYQCFDAGYTHQGRDGWHENNIVRRNLMEYSNYNIEVWTSRDPAVGGARDGVIEDNILRFAGYGFGTKARIGSNSSAVGNISMYNYPLPHRNFVIRNNILDCSTRYLVSIAYPNDPEGRGPTIKGNIWNQKPYHTADSAAAVNRLNKHVSADPDERPQTIVLPCGSQEEMEAGVAKTDLAPLEITYEG